MTDTTQTKATRTVALIEQAQEIGAKPSEVITRLHTILCMDHVFDSTAKDILKALIDTQHIAWAIDVLMKGDSLNAWDYHNETLERMVG